MLPPLEVVWSPAAAALPAVAEAAVASAAGSASLALFRPPGAATLIAPYVTPEMDPPPGRLMSAVTGSETSDIQMAIEESLLTPREQTTYSGYGGASSSSSWVPPPLAASIPRARSNVCVQFVLYPSHNDSWMRVARVTNCPAKVPHVLPASGKGPIDVLSMTFLELHVDVWPTENAEAQQGR